MSAQRDYDETRARILSDPTTCRVFTKDIAVHWYPTPDSPTCYCGELQQNHDEEEA